MIFEKETPRENENPALPEIGPQAPAAPALSWESELDFVVDSTGFHQGPRQRRSGAKLVIWSWAAAATDALLMTGVGILFFVFYILIVKSQGLSSQGMNRENIFQIFLGIYGLLSFFYMIVLRSFVGFTMGEWACGLRLGSPLQRMSPYYTLRVFARSLLLFASGVVLLPILSLFLRKDLAGQITGLSLISLR